MAIPCIAATGMNAVAPEVLGTAVGILNTVQQLSAFFGIAIGTAALACWVRNVSPAANERIGPGGSSLSAPSDTSRGRTDPPVSRPWSPSMPGLSA